MFSCGSVHVPLGEYDGQRTSPFAACSEGGPHLWDEPASAIRNSGYVGLHVSLAAGSTQCIRPDRANSALQSLSGHGVPYFPLLAASADGQTSELPGPFGGTSDAGRPDAFSVSAFLAKPARPTLGHRVLPAGEEIIQERHVPFFPIGSRSARETKCGNRRAACFLPAGPFRVQPVSGWGHDPPVAGLRPAAQHLLVPQGFCSIQS